MDKSITSVAGVGKTRAQYFEKLGVSTVSELLSLYPRRYEDVGNVIDICDLARHRGAKVTVRGSVCAALYERRLSGGRTLTRVPVADDSGAVALQFFNNKFIKNRLHGETEYFFYGKVTDKGPVTIYNPEVFETLPNGGGLLPVYPLTAGLTQGFMRKTVAAALKDYAPDDALGDIARKRGLCGYAEALRLVNAPTSWQDVYAGRDRLIFEELLYFSLGVRMMKSRGKAKSGVVVTDFPREFLNAHGFEPTNAQKRALSDIYRDLESGYCMHRLLQGDVGSGKTLVAGQAAYCVIRAGAQAAIMAPTEVLANQHAEYFSKMLAPLGVSVALLTSSVPAAGKREIKARLKSGEIDLVIGTHAVLQKDVEFKKLGLVVTDEQHRFGVTQRASLADKGSGVHVLVMSATPIPRTLALMLWGDLDLSVIDELPAGRRGIKTYLVDSSFMTRLEDFIQKQIDVGGQVYYVCPMIEEDEEADLSDAVGKQKQLAKRFPGVGLLHGKMKPAEKDAAMRDFASGKTKVLVSTTVIEVGVNVPNATLMLIENAERFGLSQLHQLRGRVGRGERQSYCVLISDADGAAKSRMEYFTSTTDGFKIAEKDLELRGPGNFFGKEQHGLMQMQIADLTSSSDTLQSAAECAGALLESDPTLSAHPAIREKVGTLFRSGLRD